MPGPMKGQNIDNKKKAPQTRSLFYMLFVFQTYTNLFEIIVCIACACIDCLNRSAQLIS